MKRLLFISLLFLVGFGVVGQTTFQKLFDSNMMVVVIGASRTIQQTSDGGFILCAYTANYGSGGSDYYLVKMDSIGNFQWAKTYGGVNDEKPADIIQTLDDGYALVGHTHSFGLNANGDAFVVKTDLNGDLEWTRNVGGISNYEGFAITQLPDSGFVVTGSSYSGIHLFKLDKSGNLLWAKQINSGIWCKGHALRTTSDGGVIVTGITSSFIFTGDIFLMKVTSNGNISWFKTYGGNGNEDVLSLQQTTDMGFIVIGSADSLGAGNSDILLIKTDSLGTVQWTKTYGGANYDFGSSVWQTTDNGFLLSGISGSNGTGTENITLIKTDNSGTLQWANTYLKGVWMFGKFGPTAQETSDGGIAVGGLALNNAPTSSTLFILKTNSTGNIACEVKPFSPTVTSPVIVDTLRFPTEINTDTIGIPATIEMSVSSLDSLMCDTSNMVDEKPVGDTKIAIYPNPTTGIFTVQGTEGTIQVHDLFGRLVLTATEPQIDMSSYPSGIYFIKAGDSVQKLIKQ